MTTMRKPTQTTTLMFLPPNGEQHIRTVFLTDKPSDDEINVITRGTFSDEGFKRLVVKHPDFGVCTLLIDAMPIQAPNMPVNAKATEIMKLQVVTDVSFIGPSEAYGNAILVNREI